MVKKVLIFFFIYLSISILTGAQIVYLQPDFFGNNKLVVPNIHTKYNILFLKSISNQTYTINTKSNQFFLFDREILTKVIEPMSSSTLEIDTSYDYILYSPTRFSLKDFSITSNINTKPVLIENQEEGIFINKIDKNVSFHNRYIIGSILLLLVFIIIKIVNRNFYKYLFTIHSQMDEIQVRSSFNIMELYGSNLSLIGLISIMLGIIVYIYADYFAQISILENIFNESPHPVLLTFYAILLVFFTLIFKWIYNNIISFTFEVSNFSNIISMEFSKTILQVLIIIIPIALIVYTPFNQTTEPNPHFLLFTMYFLMILFIAKELYYFYKYFSFKKIYIIAYICICELFPTCVLLKFLTKIDSL